MSKKKRSNRDERRREAIAGVSAPLSGRATLIKVITLALCFALIFSLYILIIRMEWMVGVYVFYGLTALLLIVVFVLNGGFNKTIPDRSQLRDSWSDDTKDRFIAFVTVGKKWSKRLMYILLPMLLTVMIDIVYMFWFM